MPAKRKPTPYVAPPMAGPANFHAQAADLGLKVVSYLRNAVLCDDGTSRWVPRDLIGKDGKTVIIHRIPDDHYAIEGWEPWHDHMFGGRYERFENALAWLQRAQEVRAGTASDFRGAGASSTPRPPTVAPFNLA